MPAGEVKLSLHFAARAIARHERVQLALAERHSTAHLKKGGGRMAAAAGGAKQEEICNIVTRKSGFGAASKISIAEISSHRLSRMLEKVRWSPAALRSPAADCGHER